jgi:hypothetical protein
MNSLNKLALAIAIAGAILPSSAAMAQNGGGFQQGGQNFGPPMGNGQDGGYMRGPQGGGFPGGGMQFQDRISDVTAPLAVLTSELKLNSTQQGVITNVQQDFRRQAQQLMPRPTQNGGFGPGQGGPQGMDAATRAKVKNIANDLSGQINAALTTEQQSALASLVSRLRELQVAQIPAQLYDNLNLTDDQYSQIGSIESSANDALKQAAASASAGEDFDELVQTVQDSHRQIHDKVVALLTSAQATALQQLTAARRQFPTSPFRQQQNGGQNAFGGQAQPDNDNGNVMGGPGGPPPDGGGFGGPGDDGVPGGPPPGENN